MVLQSLHLIVKSLAGDAKEFSGLGEVAVTVVDGTADMFLLHLVETDNLVFHVEYILQLMYQFVVVPRLGNEVGSTVLQSLDRQVHVGVGRQEDDRRLRMLFMDGPKPEESFT